jgi:RNA polymerase sigma-70 factor (ECF subfamily)
VQSIGRGRALVSDHDVGLQAALVNGAVGVVVALRGQLFVVLGLAYSHHKIAAIDVIADPERLIRLDLATLSG